jgi:hypothetical protein
LDFYLWGILRTECAKMSIREELWECSSRNETHARNTAVYDGHGSTVLKLALKPMVTTFNN